MCIFNVEPQFKRKLKKVQKNTAVSKYFGQQIVNKYTKV